MESKGTPEPPGRAAPAIAYATAAANLAAGAVMLFWLRPGLPAAEDDLSARIHHVRTHVAQWRLGWLVWTLAAIALVAFYATLAHRWRRRAPVACRVAVALASAGLAADVGAETLLMIVQPGLDAAEYALVESMSIALTGYLGNGLYVLAGILLTAAGRRDLPAPLVWLAGAAWTAGLGLSAATLAGSETGQFWSTALLMPLFVAWAASVGRWLSARAS